MVTVRESISKLESETVSLINVAPIKLVYCLLFIAV